MANRFPIGFTLIELMITVAVITIIIAVALPFYREYIESARRSVLNDNIQTIRLMQEERRIELGEYVEGVYDPRPGGAITISTRLNWSPRKNRDVVKYEVVCVTDGALAGECDRTSGYTVTATYYEVSGDPPQYIASSDPVTRNFSPP